VIQPSTPGPSTNSGLGLPTTIWVKPEHIRKALSFGDPSDPTNCPIALALADMLPTGCRLWVDYDGVTVEMPGRRDGCWWSPYDRKTKLFLNLWDRYAQSWNPRYSKRLDPEQMRELRAELLAQPPVVQMDWTAI
jgi:hypothetical protein